MSADDFNTNISFHLDLLYNNIKRINITFYKQEFRITNRSNLLNLGSCGIDIRFNHLFCDCYMYEMAAWLKQFQHDTDHRNPVFTIKCYSPSALYGTDLVDDTGFNCTVVEQCPSGCKCAETYSSKLLTVTCNGANFSSTLPDEVPSQFKEININIKNTPLEVLEPRPYLNKVTIFDILQNKIKFIDEHTLPYLNKIKTVCLNDNLLNYLPKKLKSMSFTNLTTLKLDGNPFKCDCHSLWMKKWLLTHTGQIPNQDKILCRSGIPMTDTNDANFLCSEPLSFDIVLSIVFGASLLIMIIGLMVRWNWTHIQVNFNIHCFRKKVRTNLKYDIFLSHSSHDDDVVYQEIIPRLESHDPPFRICRDDRDFVVGWTFAYNIISNIRVQSNNTARHFQ